MPAASARLVEGPFDRCTGRVLGDNPDMRIAGSFPAGLKVKTPARPIITGRQPSRIAAHAWCNKCTDAMFVQGLRFGRRGRVLTTFRRVR